MYVLIINSNSGPVPAKLPNSTHKIFRHIVHSINFIFVRPLLGLLTRYGLVAMCLIHGCYLSSVSTIILEIPSLICLDHTSFSLLMEHILEVTRSPFDIIVSASYRSSPVYGSSPDSMELPWLYPLIIVVSCSKERRGIAWDYL